SPIRPKPIIGCRGRGGINDSFCACAGCNNDSESWACPRRGAVFPITVSCRRCCDYFRLVSKQRLRRAGKRDCQSAAILEFTADGGFVSSSALPRPLA